MKTWRYYEVFLVELDTSIRVVDSFKRRARAVSMARAFESRVSIPVFVNEVVHSSEKVLSEKLIYPMEV